MRKWLSVGVVSALLAGLLVAPSVSAEVQPQKFVVVLKGEAVTASALSAIRAAGGTVVSQLGQIGAVTVETTKPTAFLKAMVKNGEVLSVGPDLKVTLDLPDSESLEAIAGSPANPSNPADYTWGIDRVTAGGAAWTLNTGSKHVVVGVIDSGIDLEHPDLVGNIVPGSKTFVPGTTDVWDYNSHGTHVAGTIAANGKIKGVAPDVGIRSYRVFPASGGASQSWITAAILAAADDGADVINMSLGGKRVMGQWYYKDAQTGETLRLGGDSASWVAYHRAIQYAVKKNVTVVASAGNDGWNWADKNAITKLYNDYLDQTYGDIYDLQGATFDAPGGVAGVITVSASGGGFGTADRLAFYSNYGNGFVNVSAPGGDYGPLYPTAGQLDSDYYKHLTLSTVPRYMACKLPKSLFGDCAYGFKAGTSMAAPHVSGVAALIIAQEYARTGVKPSPAQVAAKLYQTADDAGKVGYDELYGNGIVNAYRALGGK